MNNCKKSKNQVKWKCGYQFDILGGDEGGKAKKL